MEYQISTDADAKPFRARPYYEVSKKFHSQINDTLVAEIISESDGSQFVCPIVMAKKSSVEWRFCVDMKILNAMIPYITNCL